MAIDKKLIDQLPTDYNKREDIMGENGLIKEPDQNRSGTSVAIRGDGSSGL